MADRGNYRSSRGDAGHRGGRGAGNRGGSHQQSQQQQDRPRKENILDLNKYVDKRITVKFSGGREVQGVLKRYDQLMNLVLDDVKETLHDDEGNKSTRNLDLIVARGPLVVLISPVDGSEEISNPFIQTEEE